MKLISNQINPHFNLWDALCAVSKIGGWSKPDFAAELETKNYRLTNTARSALGIIIDVLKLDKDKRIAIPAFICGVVATPFLERGYQIEWIDVDENGLIDPKDFEGKASQVGLVVVPHIFGQPAPLKAISDIAQKHDIFVVEDGAHFLNTEIKDCDAKILSFGREKVISCVSGGALLWPETSRYAAEFKKYELPSTSMMWQIQHALQPLIFALGKYWWQLGGKIIPAIALKIKLLPLAVTKAEKQGREDIKIKAMGNIQKRILKRQWRLWDRRTRQAQGIAQTWKQILPVDTNVSIPQNAFRVILKFKSTQDRTNFIKQYLVSRRWHTRDWDGVPISPQGVKLKAFGYEPGQCRGAEKFAQTYLTLPTNIYCQTKDIKRLEKHA